MKKNTIIFLIWGVILNIVFFIDANLSNMASHPFETIGFIIEFFYTPFVLSFFINKVENIQKTEKANKILKIISKIINILIVIYLIFISFVSYVATAFA